MIDELDPPEEDTDDAAGNLFQDAFSETKEKPDDEVVPDFTAPDEVVAKEPAAAPDEDIEL